MASCMLSSDEDWNEYGAVHVKEADEKARAAGRGLMKGIFGSCRCTMRLSRRFFPGARV
jgi:hypothetical protein